MKKLLVVASLLVTGTVALGQGYLNFGNRVIADGIAVPIRDGNGVPLAGPDYNAQLYWGTLSDPSTFVAAGSPVPFRTGAFAGYISSVVVTLPGTSGGQTVFTQMRAWAVANGFTYDAAKATGFNYGESNVVPVQLAVAPNTPNNMIGLAGFPLIPVPEPSMIALGVLGLGLLPFCRRK